MEYICRIGFYNNVAELIFDNQDVYPDGVVEVHTGEEYMLIYTEVYEDSTAGNSGSSCSDVYFQCTFITATTRRTSRAAAW